MLLGELVHCDMYSAQRGPHLFFVEVKEVVVFQMYHRSVGLIWNEKVFKEGQVGTQTVVLPNIQSQLSAWTCEQDPERDYMGDFYFFRRTIDKWPGKDAELVWVPVPIAVHRMSWVQSEIVGEWKPIQK